MSTLLLDVFLIERGMVFLVTKSSLNGYLSRKEMSNSRRTYRILDVISLPGSAFAPEHADDAVHETRLSITSLKRSAKPAVRDHGLGCLRCEVCRACPTRQSEWIFLCDKIGCLPLPFRYGASVR